MIFTRRRILNPGGIVIPQFKRRLGGFFPDYLAFESKVRPDGRILIPMWARKIYGINPRDEFTGSYFLNMTWQRSHLIQPEDGIIHTCTVRKYDNTVSVPKELGAEPGDYVYVIPDEDHLET